MRFDPRSEKDLEAEALAARGLLPNGPCAFTVLDAVDKVSKAGNEMIVMTVEIVPNDPLLPVRNLTDYLLESMAFKLRHFCGATGLIGKYEHGTLEARDCIRKSGICMIGIEQDKDKKFPPKNRIADYVVDATAPQQDAPTEPPVTRPKSQQPEMSDSDIPF